MELQNCDVNKVIVKLSKDSDKINQKKLDITASKLEEEFKNLNKFDQKELGKKITYVLETYKNVLKPATKDVNVKVIDENLIDIIIELIEKKSTKSIGFDTGYDSGLNFNVVFKDHNFLSKLYRLSSAVGLNNKSISLNSEIVRDVIILKSKNILNLKIGYDKSPFGNFGIDTTINENTKINNQIIVKKEKILTSHTISYSKIDNIYFPSKGFFGKLNVTSSNDINSDVNIWIPLGYSFTFVSNAKIEASKSKIKNLNPNIFVERPINQMITLGFGYFNKDYQIQTNVQTPFGIFTIPFTIAGKNKDNKYKFSAVKDVVFNLDSEIITTSKKIKIISKKIMSITNLKKTKLKDISLKKISKKKNFYFNKINKVTSIFDPRKLKMRTPFLL